MTDRDLEDLIFCARASTEGGYWLAAETLRRTREDLYHIGPEWILRSHGYVTVVHVLDVETTGLKPEEGDLAVEVAAVLIAVKTDGDVIVQKQGARSSFVNPHRPIPPQASGVHHIIDTDVLEAPDLDAALDLTLRPFGLDAVDICAAHNSNFDRSFLPALADRQWIDTCQCAKHIWPDAPNFKNQTLRYWLNLDLPRNGAHRALEDATVTAHILARMLSERTVNELLELSGKPVLLEKVSFGKHYGKQWNQVPADYLNWIWREMAGRETLRKAGLSLQPSNFDDQDLIFTVKTYLFGAASP